MPSVSLAAVLEALETASDEVRAYIRRSSGDVITVFDSGLFGEAEDDDQPNQDELDSDDYVALPTRFDVNEWAIMRSFCEELDDDAVRQRLLRAIHGTGAFRRFKDEVYDAGIQDIWFAYKVLRLAQIAREFVVYEDLAFIDDVGSEL